MREKKAICFCFSDSDSSGLNLGPKGGETPHLISKRIILTCTNPGSSKGGDKRIILTAQTQEALTEETREKRWGKTACRGWVLTAHPVQESPAWNPRPQGATCPGSRAHAPCPARRAHPSHGSRICHCESRCCGLSRPLPVPIPHASQGCSTMASGMYIPEANLLQLQNFPYTL